MVLTDTAAERAVLCGVCQFGKDVYIDVDFLDGNCFTYDVNRVVYECIKYIYREKTDIKIDLSLLLTSSKELGLSLEADTKYLLRFFEFGIEKDNVVEFAKKIKRLSYARNLLDLCDQIKDDVKQINGSETLNHILGLVENKVFDFTNGLASPDDEISLFGEGLDEYIQYVESNPTDILGIPIGYPLLEEAIGYIREGEYYVFGARSGVGKSLLLTAIALHVSIKQKIPVLYLDTEMSKKGHWPRCLATMTEIPISLIEKGKYTNKPENSRKIRKAANLIKESPFFYAKVPGLEFDDILSYMRRWLIKHVGFDKKGQRNRCIIIYDYLKLMNDDTVKNMAEHQIIGFQCCKLHDFANKYNVPVLTGVQLNRDGIDDETTGAISQSDRILWNAGGLALLKEKTADEMGSDGPENGNRKVIVLKARFGPGHDTTRKEYISYQCRKELTKLTELRTSRQIYAEKKNKRLDEHEESAVGGTISF